VIPAHFWALAMKYRDDYAAAGIPMLPVVRGARVTVRQIAGYAMITVSLTPRAGAHGLGRSLLRDLGRGMLGAILCCRPSPQRTRRRSVRSASSLERT
jgi:heme O synthase-like polyprenyltransferase